METDPKNQASPTKPSKPKRRGRIKAEHTLAGYTLDGAGKAVDGGDGAGGARLEPLPQLPEPKAPGRPKGFKEIAGVWLAFQATEPGITNAEIARRIGITRQHLWYCVSKAIQEGVITVYDPIERIEYGIIPKTLDALEKLIEEGSEKAVIETAKGTVFKTYLDAKGVQEVSQTVLALKIEAPPEGSDKVMVGHIVGRPKKPRDEDESE